MKAPPRPPPHRTIAVGAAFKLVRLAADAGVSPDVLRSVDLPPRTVNGFETRIPYETQLQLWEVAMRALRDPAFPVTVASRVRTSDYSVVGFACMTRPNLREALHQAVRYARIWTDATRWELRETDRTVTLTLVGDDRTGLGARCNTECVLAEMVNAARELTGLDARPDAVQFRHDEPSDTRAHATFFGSPLRFGAHGDALVFDASLLDAPLVKADPDLAAFFKRHTDALLERCGPARSVADRLENALVERIPQGLPTLDAAARCVGMSARTLRRRLAAEGTRFQDVLLRARCKLSKRYLGEPTLALGQVAFLVGFSEPSAFHRAFKRWTGQTPLAYRSGTLGG